MTVLLLNARSVKQCVKLLAKRCATAEPLCPRAAMSAALSPFETMILREKLSAKKYVILEDKCNVWSRLTSQAVSELLDCEVQSVSRYSYNKRRLALVELQNSDSFFRDKPNNRLPIATNCFPIRTRMMAICSAPKSLRSSGCAGGGDAGSPPELSRKDKTISLSAGELKRLYPTNESLLEFLLEDKGMSELELKLRFFVVLQLEDLLCSGAFNHFAILPFGSSLAGFGTPSSDLDLVLKSVESTASAKQHMSYECREMTVERSEAQRSIEIIGDLVQHLMPNFSNVFRILRARIPIVRCSFDLAPIDIDLSIEISPNSAHHGIIMASYISHCNSLHTCVRQLIILVKFWAKQHGIIKSQAGHWFSSFQLTTLVIFYLQTLNILPPMSIIVNKRPPKIELNNNVDVNISDLLRDFFRFLLNFQYTREGISILNARIVSKPDYSAIYVENPIERDLNVCKNVSPAELDKFLYAAYGSANIMSGERYHLADVFESNFGFNNKSTKKTNSIKAESLFEN